MKILPWTNSLEMTETLQRHRITIAVVALLAVAVLLYSPRVAEIHELGGATMGTTYSIKIVDMPTDHLAAEDLAQAVAALLKRIDQEQMSTYVPESELSRLNRAPVPLVNRWGFGPPVQAADTNNARVPDQAEIALLLERVGYHHLTLDSEHSTLLKSADVYIDLSGIAKGFAVDKVAEYFDQLGIASYFIEIGGELRIKGHKPGGQTWVPAIEKPVDTAPQVHNIFYNNGESIAVAGSGDYRNYFEADGVHYSHEIDPATGRPIAHNLAGVYVIDSLAARADAMATAYMVLGAEKGFELARRIDQAVYFVTKRADGDGFDDRYTRKFESYLQAK
jgi:FAD:protein FMN transferase